MPDFDDGDCLRRYIERASAVPGMAHNPPGKIYHIVDDPEEMRWPATATRDTRRAGGDLALDTWVGVLTEDPYVTSP